MEKIFMLTIDGTSSGDYENGAFSLLFKTREEAKKWVESDFIEQVEFISKATKNNFKWFNENEAQFRYGNAIRDYKIEEVGIPS